MATKYAVVSGSWSDTATWSDTDGGAGGATVPADDDAVVISANVSVLMDVDQSLFANGIAGMTIRSHATTPGMLYFKNGTDGYLKIKTGTVVQGTNAAIKGRILANADGVWGNTEPLQVSNTANIYMVETAKFTGTYLDVRLYCAQPTTKVVRVYGTKFDVTVDVANSRLVSSSPHGLTTGAIVAFSSTGTLPTPLESNIIYAAVVVDSTKFAVRWDANWGNIPITSAGTGTLTVYTAHANTSTAIINVMDDVSGESSYWTGTTGRNYVILSEWGSIASEELLISSIASGAITFTSNISGAYSPLSVIVLVSRNVQVHLYGTTSRTVFAGTIASWILQCEIRGLPTANLKTSLFSGTVTDTILSGTMSGLNWVFSQGANTRCVFSGIITKSNSITYWTSSGAAIGDDSFIFSGQAYGVVTVIYGTTAIVKSTAVIAGCSYAFNSSIASIEGGHYIGASTTMFYAMYMANITGGRFRNYYLFQNNCRAVELYGGDLTGCAIISSGTCSVYCYGLTFSLITKITGGAGSFMEFNNCTMTGIKSFGDYQFTLTLRNSTLGLMSASTLSLGRVTSNNSIISNYSPITTTYRPWVDNYNNAHVFTDYNQQAGYIRAHNGGGSVITEAYSAGTHGTPPVTLALIHKATFEYANLNGFDFHVGGQANVLTVFKVYMKKSVNSMTVTPYVEICDPRYGFGQTGEQLAIATMVDDTNWQTLTVSYRPTDNRPLILRVAGENLSGTLFWNWEQVNVSETKLIDSTVYDSVIY